MYYPMVRINHNLHKYFPNVRPRLFMIFITVKNVLVAHARFLIFFKGLITMNKHIRQFVHIHSANGGECNGADFTPF